MKGLPYTWTNGRFGDARYERKLDRLFMNQAWKDTWPNMICNMFKGGSSDHSTLDVHLHQIVRSRRPFRFLYTWIDESFSNELVVDCWNTHVTNTTIFHLNQKLRLIKSATKNWLKLRTFIKDQINMTLNVLKI